MFILRRGGLEEFLAASSTIMESLPLKELDFGLQKLTVPSSGVVAPIVLVFPGLDCPGLSLAEVCATCQRCLKVSYSKVMLVSVNVVFHRLLPPCVSIN